MHVSERRRVRIGIGATIAAGAMIAVGVTARRRPTTARTRRHCATPSRPRGSSTTSRRSRRSPTPTAATGPPAPPATWHPPSMSRASCRPPGTTPGVRTFTYDQSIVDTAVLAQTRAGTGDLRVRHRLHRDELRLRGRRHRPGDRRRRQPRRRPRIDERLRGRRLRRLHGRQHRPDPARHVHLPREGRQRRCRRAPAA